ncbi:hypothetical protein BDQ17DRAFT_1356520, partial [Cyathus striatus]
MCRTSALILITRDVCAEAGHQEGWADGVTGCAPHSVGDMASGHCVESCCPGCESSCVCLS